MAEVWGALLGYAVGIAVSPVPIIAVILMLFSARARTNAPAFLVGWLLGVAAVATVVQLVPGMGGDSGEPSTAAGVVKGVLGAVLLLAAVRQWRSRPGPGEVAPVPRWMAGIDQMRPPGALGIAVLLSGVNPKNLVLAAAAGVSIAAADLSAGQVAVTVLGFTVLASLTIAVPVLGYLVASERVEPALNRGKDWLTANNGTVMAVLFVVFAFLLLGDAISILGS